MSRERRRAMTHLQFAFGDSLPPSEKSRIYRACMENLGKTLMETVKLPYLSSDEIRDMVTVEGENYLQKALAEGNGAIIMTGHIGNWELGAATMACRNYRIGVVSAPIYDPWIEQWMVRIRKSYGIETIVRGQANTLRRIFSILKAGGVIAMLIDQDTRVEGVFVPFFGRDAYTPSGPALIALRIQTPVLPGFMVRQKDGSHKMIFKEATPMIRTGNPESDIRSNTAAWMGIVEQTIRENPEQWVWMHRRWKTVKGPE